MVGESHQIVRLNEERGDPRLNRLQVCLFLLLLLFLVLLFEIFRNSSLVLHVEIRAVGVKNLSLPRKQNRKRTNHA